MKASGINKAYFVALLVLAILTACVKGNDSIQFPTSYVMFWNSYSGTSDTLSFSVNDLDVLTGPISRDTSSRYNQIYSGEVSLAARIKGTETNLFKQTVTLSGLRYYSCFVAGAGQTPDVLFVHDSLATPEDRANAALRFVTLAKGAPALSLAVTDTATLVADQSYLKASSFRSFTAGSTLLRLFDASNPSALLDTLRFRAGLASLYTVTVATSADGKYRLKVKIQQ